MRALSIAPRSLVLGSRLARGSLNTWPPCLTAINCRLAHLTSPVHKAQAETHSPLPRRRVSTSASTAVGIPPEAKKPGSAALPIVIQTKGVPVYLYTQKDAVEPDALRQLISIAESPLPVAYVAAMPDVHLGKGVTIGSVFASDKYVCPNAVGVDIGCGMCAVPIKGLYKSDVSVEKLRSMQQIIKRRIPTGFDEHKTSLRGAAEKLDAISDQKPPSKWLQAEMGRGKAAKQLGTLGGGNHFLEVVHDENEQVWVLLHSGSRNVGNVTAQHYDEVAMKLLQRRGAPAARREGINYMEVESKEGQEYLQDMAWCQDYAMANRQFMLNLMVDTVNEVAGGQADMKSAVNIHHNYCACERCTYTDPKTGQLIERDLWVTRKGATSARPGQLGIIPGSMGVGSFIVRGKGEPQSWSSCSHGAGRQMSRTKAFDLISQSDFEAAMEGIVCDTDPLVRDEAPQAYKDLTQVMENQRDLVDIVHRLTTLVNVKGYGKQWSKK